MKPSEIAAEASKLIHAAGLGKDVIDLLQIKIDLLAGEVDRLEKENNQLRRELGLAQRATANQSEKKGLTDAQVKFLKVFFKAGDDVRSVEDLAHQFSLEESVARYHFDKLRDADLIYEVQAGGLNYGSGQVYTSTYRITKKGRAYIVENGLHDGATP